MSIPDNFFEDANDIKGREIAFNLVVGLRDALNIAIKKQIPPTYEQTLNILHDIDPNIYKYCTQVLLSKNENETVKLYKAKAEAQSKKTGTVIDPIDLLKEEIMIHEDFLTADLPAEKNDPLKIISQFYPLLSKI